MEEFGKSIHNNTYTLKKLNHLFSKNGNESLCTHLNILSLPYRHEKPHSLISNLKVQTKMTAISERRLKRGKYTISRIDSKNYTFEYTATEASKGGTLLYIANGIRYKLRKDVLICKLKQLKPTFVELVNSNRKNIIKGSIHKHPTLNNQYFLGGYIVPLYFMLSFENEEIILLEDFNIYLSNYHTDKKIT